MIVNIDAVFLFQNSLLTSKTSKMNCCINDDDSNMHKDDGNANDDNDDS